jgi:prepilin-type N-terminal cleavage/methylation domain-containing protein
VIARSLRDARGFTLVEFLVAAAIFMIVAAGMTALYVFSLQSVDDGSAQAWVQREGTLIQEDLARRILPAVSVQTLLPPGQICGPSGANASLLFQITGEEATREQTAQPSLPWSRFRCVYEFQETADPGPQLYLCWLPDDGSNPIPTGPTATGCAASSRLNLLGRPSLDMTGSRLGIGYLRVSNTAFTQLTEVGTLPISRPIVDIRYDLHYTTATGGILFGRAQQQPAGQVGLRFGFSTTIRN